MTVHHKFDRERHDGESLNSAISDAMAAVVRDYTGHAPTAVDTTIRNDTVIVTLENTLTQAERALVGSGRRDEAIGHRSGFQTTMRAEASAAVEGLTGRTVVAIASADHIDPLSSGEIFVLNATLGPEATHSS